MAGKVGIRVMVCNPCEELMSAMAKPFKCLCSPLVVEPWDNLRTQLVFRLDLLVGDLYWLTSCTHEDSGGLVSMQLHLINEDFDDLSVNCLLVEKVSSSYLFVMWLLSARCCNSVAQEPAPYDLGLSSYEIWIEELGFSASDPRWSL